MKKSSIHRPDTLEGAPLKYAPQNELGVVFLFSHLAKKMGIKSIDEIRPQFPDCIAYKKVGGREKKIRIEFEFKSKNFKTQRHPIKGCDMIVCWEHNWPDSPKNIEIVELRKFFDLGFNVWIQPVSQPYSERLSGINSNYEWTVSSLAHKGDLILFYHTNPESYIKDVFKLTGDVQKTKDKWKYSGAIRRVCSLKDPLHFRDLKTNKFLKTASFVRGQMQGRPKATEHWPYIYELIVKRNPSLKKMLSKYSPDRI